MKKPTAHVTDHAVIRYLERVLGVDVDGLRNRIGRIVENGIEKGAGGVIINGYVFKLRGKAVTTIVHHNLPARRTRMRRRAKCTGRTIVSCYDCGRPYGWPGFPDLVIPSDVWAKISPKKNEGGLLCPSCICARLEALGIQTTGKFTSGPLTVTASD